jgi:hypothetical protein
MAFPIAFPMVSRCWTCGADLTGRMNLGWHYNPANPNGVTARIKREFGPTWWVLEWFYGEFMPFYWWCYGVFMVSLWWCFGVFRVEIMMVLLCLMRIVDGIFMGYQVSSGNSTVGYWKSRCLMDISSNQMGHFPLVSVVVWREWFRAVPICSQNSGQGAMKSFPTTW